MGFYSNLDIEVRQAVKELYEQNDNSYWLELCTKYPTIIKYDDAPLYAGKE